MCAQYERLDKPFEDALGFAETTSQDLFERYTSLRTTHIIQSSSSTVARLAVLYARNTIDKGSFPEDMRTVKMPESWERRDGDDDDDDTVTLSCDLMRQSCFDMALHEELSTELEKTFGRPGGCATAFLPPANSTELQNVSECIGRDFNEFDESQFESVQIVQEALEPVVLELKEAKLRVLQLTNEMSALNVVSKRNLESQHESALGKAILEVRMQSISVSAWSAFNTFKYFAIF